MKTEMKITCTKCGNTATTEETNLPSGAVAMKSNYCPKCDEGDFYEDWFVDSEGNEILYSENKIS